VFTGDTDAANTAAGIAGKNLLTLTAGTAASSGLGDAGQLLGVSGQQSATLNGSEPTNPVVFTSAIIKLAGATDQIYRLSFSSVVSIITYLGFPFTYLDSFTAAGTGIFAATPPTAPAVPEPGVIAFFVGMAFAGGALRLRRRV